MTTPAATSLRHPFPSRFAPRRLSFALALAVAATAQAAGPTLPTGLQVVQGQATTAVNGNKLTVTNSNGAILNWQSFSIGAQNAVRFEQPNAASKVLNRVTGNDPSNILGSLSSNGQVWLLNPNGVLFGQGARVDVAGLVVSTLNLNDSDWTAGRYVFAGPVSGPNGAVAGIANQGEIRAASGGQVMLLSAGEIRNEGVIEASGGQIVLAAGASVELLDTASPRLSVKVSAPAGEVLNLGQVSAAGGRIDVLAASVNQQGVVKADALSVGPGGEIVIRADQRLTLAAGSKTSADAANGQGGSIQLLGTQVALQDGSAVSASGASGGGTVLVGGGARGQDASVPNADAVYVAPGASIAADALTNGDGGHIVLWSNTATRAYGSLSARGGALGGDGGLIETSGGWLDARPTRLDVSAPHGKAGTWLLDPYDILISDDSEESGTDENFTATSEQTRIYSGRIAAALNAGTDVVVQTGTGEFVDPGEGSPYLPGNDRGSITLSQAHITVTGNTPGSLSLIADADITMTGSTISSTRPMNVTLLAGRNDYGTIELSASTIKTAGGNITLGGYSEGTSPYAGVFEGGTYGSEGSDGIALRDASVLDASGDSYGNIRLAGIGDSTGVLIDSGAILKGNEIEIHGDGYGNGVRINNASITGKSSMLVEGYASSGAGVSINGISVLRVAPDDYSETRTLRVYGISDGGNAGVEITSQGAVLQAGLSTYLDVVGANDGGVETSPALDITGTLDASAGYGLTLTANTWNAGEGGGQTWTRIDGATLSGPYISISGSTWLDIYDSQISASQQVAIKSANVYLGSGTRITAISPYSSDGGIVITGNDYYDSEAQQWFQAPVESFANDAGATALRIADTSYGGRWIIWARDITDSESFRPGELAYDFTRHGARSSSDWSGDAGNGYVSYYNQYASASYGGEVTKTYDGNTTLPAGSLSEVSVYAYGLDTSGTIDTGYIQFASKDVGYGALAVDPRGVTFKDSQSKPIYGIVVDGLYGEITPKAISASIVVATKTYDTTTSATASLQYTGLVEGESLGGNVIAQFQDPHAGVNKPVAAEWSYADGSDGTGLLSNYTITGPNSDALRGTIVPATLNLSGLTALNKVYDTTTAAQLSGSAGLSGVFAGDSVGLSGTASGNFADKNVGTAKPVSVSGLTLTGASAGDYTIAATPPGLVADITPAPLPVSGLVAQNKVYDRTTAATLVNTGAVQALGNDQVTVSGGVGVFNDRNVGTGKTVTVTGIELGGADAGNYTASSVALTADITPLGLVVGGLSAVGKVYDATTLARLSGTATVTPLAGDVVSVGGGSAQFADKNAGVSKPVSVSGLTLSGADAGNYTLIAPTNLAADITPAQLLIQGLSANGRVYDGTVLATLSGSASVTPLAGDVVGVTGSASAQFLDKNAGTNKPVSVSGLALSGTDAGNYVAVQPGGLSATITPAPLPVTGLGASGKVYDATTAATITGSASISPLAGDSVSLGGSASGSFADKNVGTAKPVSVGGLVLAGADAGNYELVTPGLSASITPLNISISGLVAQDKVYDAGTLALLGGSASVTALAGDVLSVGGTASGSFADKNVGTGKAVSVAGLVLEGADAGNYRLLTPGLSASITPRTVNLNGLSAQDKVYDATTAATLSGTAGVVGLAGDALSVGGTASGRFADKNVGTGKTVTVGGLALEGADAGNYVLATADLSASITPRTVSVSGLSAQDKVYDATTAATLGGTAAVAGLAGDVLSVGGTASGRFADKNVGTGKAVSVNGLVLEGADAGNYLIAAPTLSASITPRSIALTGLSAQDKVYDATTAATLSGSAGVVGLAGDVLSVGGTAAGNFTDKNVGNGKSVSVGGLALAGADAGNYVLVVPTLSASITPATLSYVANAATGVEGAVPALGGSVSGFVGGETQASATSGTLLFTTPASSASPAGSYAVDGQGLTAQNYRFVQAAGNATALTLTAATTPPPPPAPQADQSVPASLNTLTNPPVRIASASPGVLDLTGPTAAGIASTASLAAVPVSFGPLRLSDMSMDALTAMLESRDRYKKALFADAVYKLQQNPALADAQACTSIKEAETGTCLITADLKREAAATVAETPAAAPGAAPTAPSAAPQPLFLSSRRHVRQAALPQIERKVAVIIGVDAYQDRTIPQLGNAVNDAEAVARLFESKLGYETVVIPNATKASVIGTLNKLALAIGPKDSVVIYYAGHGDVVEAPGQGAQGYWLLSDADAKKPETWLSNNDIGRLVGQIGASQVALISDSCYSGSLVAADQRIRASGTQVDPAQVLAQKSIVVMSSGGNEPVFDSGRNGHSPFSYNLMNQLGQVSAWQAGGNVFERVRFAVARELPQRPQYGAAAGHTSGGDYLFEHRQLDTTTPQ